MYNRCKVYSTYMLLVQEQELYKKEDLGLTEVSFIDNQDCISELQTVNVCNGCVQYLPSNNAYFIHI